MAINDRLRFLLCLLTFKTGFSAEISVVVQTGNSVQLHIQTQELPEFDDLSWKNDKSEIIVKYTSETKRVRLHSSFKDRVDFNNTTFSLTLKNMQKTDSGLFRAITAGELDNNIVTYRVSVIDAVEAPVLTINANWSSGDSCTVNFTCRAHELMINSSYQNNRCSPEEVTSHENYTLVLDCSEESITCNHSNPISWNEDKISIKEICINKDGWNNDQIESSLLWPVVGLVAVCSLICLSVCLIFKYKKGDQEEVVESSTVYAQVEAEDHTREKTRDNRPITIYCTLGQHQKPTIPPETDHTVYSVEYKQPNKNPSSISPDDT